MSNSKPNLMIAISQLTSVDRVEENLATVLAHIKTAAEQGAQLIVFPENTIYMRLDSSKPLQALELSGEEFRRIEMAAKDHGLHVLLTTPIKGEAGKAKNATLYWSPGQPAKVVYSKIHLFDVEVDGAPPVRESDHFWPGEKPETLEILGWRFGLSICYDLRFAELYAHYAGVVDAILIPSAFLVPTGEAHWNVLIRARAIENQAFVIAPAQTGAHRSETGTVRKTYGHSMVVDPWGRVLLDESGGPGVKTVELQADLIAKVKKQIPMHFHRRLKS